MHDVIGMYVTLMIDITDTGIAMQPHITAIASIMQSIESRPKPILQNIKTGPRSSQIGIELIYEEGGLLKFDFKEITH